MKKLLFIAIALLIGMVGTASAGSKFVWDKPMVENVKGYTIYFGPESDNKIYNYTMGYVFECPVNALNLVPGVKYYFVVRAFNDVMESTDSNEISHTVPLYVPPVDKLPDGISEPPDYTVLQVD